MLRAKDILTFNERKILTFLLVTVIAGCLIQYLRLSAEEQDYSGEIDSLLVRGQLIDIRTATAEELESLPKIGPKLAARIIAYRNKTPFINTSDLVNVKGIGPKTMIRLKHYLLQFGADKVESEVIKEETSISGKLDINSAGKSDFIKLKGIGEVKAQRIIDKREELGKFSSIEDLLKVKGIGEKTLEKLKPFIKCER